jgi:hypothetical protein
MQRKAPLHYLIFRDTWRQLSAWGECDGWGGVESRRVLRAWIRAGRPAHLAEFIARWAGRPAHHPR